MHDTYDPSDMSLEFSFSIIGRKAKGELCASNKQLFDSYSLQVADGFPYAGKLEITKVQEIVSMTDEPPRIFVIKNGGYLYLPPAEYMNFRRQAPVWKLPSGDTVSLTPEAYRANGTPLSWPSSVLPQVWSNTADYLSWQIEAWGL